MATTTDIEADLTFEIDGSAVTPERFQRGVTAFFDLLAEVTKAVAPVGERVEWRVQVKKGSNLVGVVPAPGVPAAVVARVRDALVGGLQRLEHEATEPEEFSERALRSVRRLTTTLDALDAGDTSIRVWGERAAVPITRHIAENVVEILEEAYSDQGSVEGRLKTVSVAGGFRVVVYEPVFNRAVRCDIPEDLMPRALDLFGRRVEVYGTVHYRRNGIVARVAVEEIVPFPEEDELPSYEDVRGILRANR